MTAFIDVIKLNKEKNGGKRAYKFITVDQNDSSTILDFPLGQVRR